MIFCKSYGFVHCGCDIRYKTHNGFLFFLSFIFFYFGVKTACFNCCDFAFDIVLRTCRVFAAFSPSVLLTELSVTCNDVIIICHCFEVFLF